MFFSWQNTAGHLRPDVRLDPRLLRRQMKARRPIHPIAIQQRHRRHSKAGTHSDKFLWKRCAFQEAESGTGVKFDIHGKQFLVSSCWFLVAAAFNL
jgi:hypothetical protein